MIYFCFPILIGIGAIVYVVYSSKRKEKLRLGLIAHGLTLLILLIGAIGTWISGYEIWLLVGAASDISVDLMYRGWKNSWYSLYISGFFATALYVTTLYVSFSKSKTLIEPQKKDRAIILSYIPAILIAAFLLLLAFSLITDISDFPYYIYPIMVVIMFSYYVVPLLGLPYLAFWGYKIYKYKSATGMNSTFFTILSIYILSFPLLFFYSYWWIHTIEQVSNPLIPYW